MEPHCSNIDETNTIEYKTDNQTKYINPVYSRDNTILEFKKINIKSERKIVQITVIEVYKYIGSTYNEYTFDIIDEEGANFVIREFITYNENSPDLVFKVGVCDDPECIELCGGASPTCEHRLAAFDYTDDYTYIRAYSETAYKIKIYL